MPIHKPLASIVIPCYNAEKYVADAIKSALSQTWPACEVIVIDDGSTDESWSQIEPFGGRIICEHGPNRGGCAARNRGLELARGEFIQFLDADDLLYPNKIEQQIASFSAEPNEVVYCDYAERPMDGSREPVRQSHVCFDDDSVLTVELGSIQTSSVLFRRTILEELGGFRVGLPCCQDRELFLRLACHGVAFRRVPETLYLVRTLPVSVCSNRTRVAEWGCVIDFEWLEYLSRGGKLTEERRKAFACGLTRKARWLAAGGRTALAKEWLAKAQAVHPTAWLNAYGRRESLLLASVGFEGTERILRAALRLREYRPFVNTGGMRERDCVTGPRGYR